MKCDLNSQIFLLKNEMIIIETEIKHHKTSFFLLVSKIKLKNDFIQR